MSREKSVCRRRNEQKRSAPGRSKWSRTGHGNCIREIKVTGDFSECRRRRGWSREADRCVSGKLGSVRAALTMEDENARAPHVIDPRSGFTQIKVQSIARTDVSTGFMLPSHQRWIVVTNVGGAHVLFLLPTPPVLESGCEPDPGGEGDPRRPYEQHGILTETERNWKHFFLT